ncbi:type II secretion system protein E [Delftia acidovorans SPH-1]|jgi:general secretion pathway protein E|uniref:Type II secretion system protein E n=3 Tax=Delftia acidovorans TaxID=80866 RepID=A9BNX9_DELAS|nr:MULTISPECIES: GspE/PulE family protein [Delftia]MCP4017596.1 Flp pilus assembly complex ATPase component [Delftia sp.]OLE96165.1 MAG: type II secretion system protein E [Delftia sp. 13_1_40CM_3_66_6]ABX38024.1 type II secretion system protein E [Delftia acidovorans SPH-1]MBJ2141013.1 Flp pilus assembly complex ATPase component TadA [Delftia acidovorans]MBO0986618.1 Flp pilus assembly complex ATPase component TadA [Delftia sp. SD083]
MSDPTSTTQPKPAVVPSNPSGPLDWRRLVQWLLADGVITAEEAQRTVARCSQAESTQHPLVRLANVGMARAGDGRALDIEELTQYLATRSGMAYLRIDPLRVDAGRVGEIMSASYAERHKVLPVQVSPQEVVVATAEPFIDDWVAEVERQARRKVRRVLASPLDLKRYTGEFFALAKSVRAAEKAGGAASAASFEQLVELGNSSKQLDANDQGVVRVVDWLWQYAFDQRASDIHMEPRREQGVIRFRIDGVLHPVYQVPMGVLNAMVSRVKLLGRMDVVEKRRPQDGRIKTRNPRGDEVEMRLSTLPTAFGEKLVMRIFDPDNTVKDLDALGFTSHDAQRWNELVRRPHGIILVTGPTGSGKTTTLYSTLKRVATEAVNVSTVEDPIEMIEPSFNQTQVQPQLDFGFTEGLRSLMRQDPDIIMVGEIRDLATAEMAVQAALTGHLVFSTLHTNDAPSAVSRLMELGVPPYLINATLLGVLAQRLVRTLCPQCKQRDEETSAATLAEAVRPWKLSGSYQPYKPVGCVECRMTGFRGRMGLYELLTVSEALKQQVHTSPSMDALRRQAVQDGMRPLRLAGALRVAEGVTTLDEVMASTPLLG